MIKAHMPYFVACFGWNWSDSPKPSDQRIRSLASKALHLFMNPSGFRVPNGWVHDCILPKIAPLFNACQHREWCPEACPLLHTTHRERLRTISEWTIGFVCQGLTSFLETFQKFGHVDGQWVFISFFCIAHEVGAMLQKHSAGGLRLLVKLPKFLLITSED